MYLKDRKATYSQFCNQENDLPLFLKDWWLDSVAGENNWNVALFVQDSKIVGCLPYYYQNSSSFKLIKMPHATPFLGVWVNYAKNQNSSSARLQFEKKVFSELIQQLPAFDYFNVRFSRKISNWLPFYWNGFSQTTRYSYVIEDLSDLEKVFGNFKGSVRTDIKKAGGLLTVQEIDDPKVFYEAYELVYLNQKKDYISFNALKKIDDATKRHSCRKMLLAKTQDGEIAAAIYVVWDKYCAYHLFGGYNRRKRISGAVSLLLWEAIKFASTKCNRFDFEGSMIEPIEKFYRSFGGVPKPYFRIYKYNSKILKLYSLFKGLN